MAASEEDWLGRALTLAGKAFAWFALAIGLFVFAGWIGSAIPRNADWTEPEDGVDLLVETNGVHTALVLPLVTPHKDWRRDFPASDLAASDAPYTHVSVSWGQREVFLETETWADLKPKTVWDALAGSEALLHVAHYVRPAPADDIRVLTVRGSEYARLVAAIERHVLPASARQSYPGYHAQDVFYDTSGGYHLGNTCNQWTADMLARAGVAIGWWTPFAGGVMKWIPEPDN